MVEAGLNLQVLIDLKGDFSPAIGGANYKDDFTSVSADHLFPRISA